LRLFDCGGLRRYGSRGDAEQVGQQGKRSEGYFQGITEEHTVGTVVISSVFRQ